MGWADSITSRHSGWGPKESWRLKLYNLGRLNLLLGQSQSVFEWIYEIWMVVLYMQIIVSLNIESTSVLPIHAFRGLVLWAQNNCWGVAGELPRWLLTGETFLKDSGIGQGFRLKHLWHTGLINMNERAAVFHERLKSISTRAQASGAMLAALWGCIHT